LVVRNLVVDPEAWIVVRIPDSTDAASGLVDLCLEVPIAKFVQQVDTREACSNGNGIQVIEWIWKGVMRNLNERRGGAI
jgi:hypothetical protein